MIRPLGMVLNVQGMLERGCLLSTAYTPVETGDHGPPTRCQVRMLVFTSLVQTNKD